MKRLRGRRTAGDDEPVADKAWRAWFRVQRDFSPAEVKRREAELTVLHGEPSWDVLLYDSFEAKIAADKIIE